MVHYIYQKDCPLSQRKYPPPQLRVKLMHSEERKITDFYFSHKHHLQQYAHAGQRTEEGM